MKISRRSILAALLSPAAGALPAVAVGPKGASVEHLLSQLILAKERYARIEAREDALELAAEPFAPHVQISSGSAERSLPPRFARTEQLIRDLFRDGRSPFGNERFKRQYREKFDGMIAEFRRQQADYDRHCAAIGLDDARRQRAEAAREVARLERELGIA